MEGTNGVSPATPVVLEWKSESIAALATALAKAQTQFEKVLRDTDNPAYVRGGKAMKYADLASVMGATQPHLAANGLTIIQMPDVSVHDQSLTLTGMMVHSSGEWIKTSLTLPAVQRDRFDAQSCGSAITYARRYQYMSMVGAAAEDDDANAASSVGSKDASAAVAKKIIEEKTANMTAGKSIQFVDNKAGMVLLIGDNGCAALRANMPEEMRVLMVRLPTKECWAVPIEKAQVFMNHCTRQGVDYTVSKEDLASITSLDKSTVSPFEAVDSDLPSMFASEHPKILAVKSLKGKNGTFLSVSWNGRDHSCFDKAMFELLVDAQNKPADLIVEAQGKYSNIKGIASIDGAEYQLGQDGQYRPALQTSQR